MLKRKNIKIFITLLTLCFSTLTLYNASAMEFKQIDAKETKEKNKINYKELKEINSNKDKDAKKEFSSKIKDIFKPVRENIFQKNYKDAEIIEKLVDAYLENDLFKYLIEKYKIYSNQFLDNYEKNSFIDIKLKHICEFLKNSSLNNLCLYSNNQLNKERYIEIMKDYIESDVKIDCRNVDFTIPESSEKKLEKYFYEYKKILDNFLKEFQNRYSEITKKIKINKNNIKNITPEIINKFKNSLITKIKAFKNQIINYLEQKIKDDSPIVNQEFINLIANDNKKILLNFITLTKENKLDKNKFITTLKNFKIIHDNSEYTINKEEELDLLTFFHKYKPIIEKEFSKESINNFLKTSPTLKEALRLTIENSHEESSEINNKNDQSILFYPPIK